MRAYVVGLYFSEDMGQVVLIRKNRPAWQKGWLNGVGGAINLNESPTQAMVREFLEETGANIPCARWWSVLTLVDPSHDNLVHFFRARGNLDNIRSTTDEAIEITDVTSVQCPMVEVIFNLKWIIPLCLQGPIYLPFTVIEESGLLDQSIR